jgi:hypothetical protein
MVFERGRSGEAQENVKLKKTLYREPGPPPKGVGWYSTSNESVVCSRIALQPSFALLYSFSVFEAIVFPVE